MSDFNIKYINETGSTDFEVMVFTKNFGTRNPKIYYVAWQVFKGQSSDLFSYPMKQAVGAIYEIEGFQTLVGPIPADLGTDWRIVQEQPTSTAVLQQVSVPKNPNGSIAVQNVPPTTWSGNKFDIGMYKSDRLLVTQKDVRVGDQVDFLLEDRLYFAICRNFNVGDVFTSLSVTSSLAEFDLSNYPDGMEVTLTQEGGGKYIFSAKNMSTD